MATGPLFALKSNGRAARKSTVAPKEPSSTSADAVLRTMISLNNSDAKILKSKPREREGPSWLPQEAKASMPLMRTRVNSGFRPRTLMVRPSPPSRSMATPGTRCKDSAKLLSGNLPMSSALMTSTTPLSSFFLDNAPAKAARKPVTTISPESAGAVCAWAICAKPNTATATALYLNVCAWALVDLLSFFMFVLLLFRIICKC